MNKYEYKVRADEIKDLISKKEYQQAVEIADTIDWHNVKNNGMLCTISDLYKAFHRYEDSRDVLLYAYERNPNARLILYSLCELSIKLNDIVNATNFFNEYKMVCQPNDSGKYILKYKLYKASGTNAEECIQVLEELQNVECKERWMYELAKLYHMIGEGNKCAEECDQIITFFGYGKYVIKALELKQEHKPLTEEQADLYHRLTCPEEEVVVSEIDMGQFNAMDLQKELADSLKEVMFDDSEAKAALEKERSQTAIFTPVREKEEPSVSTDTKIFTPVQNTESEQSEEAVSDDVVEEVAAQESLVEEVTAKVPVAEIAATEEKSDEPEEDSFDEENDDEDGTSFAEEQVKEEKNDKVVLPVEKVDAGSQPLKSVGVFGGMREVMPSGATNPRIVFPNYDDMVSLEGDGQMSFVMPDQQVVEKQITGQISINDMLLEWERMKSASEKRWADDMRRRVQEKTGNIFKEFDESARVGLLERLESSVNATKVIELTKEEEDALSAEGLQPVSSFEEVIELVDDFEGEASEEIAVEVKEETVEEAAELKAATEDTTDEASEEAEKTEEIVTPAVAEEDIKPWVPKDIHEIFVEPEEETEDEDVSEESAEETGEGPESVAETEEAAEETAEEIAEDIAEEPAEDIAEEIPEESTEEAVNEDPTPEELYFDRTPFLEKEKEIELESDISSLLPEPEADDNTQIIPQNELDDYFMRFAQAGEERDLAEQALLNQAAVSEPEEELSDFEKTVEEALQEAEKTYVQEITEKTLKEAEEAEKEEPVAEEIQDFSEIEATEEISEENEVLKSDEAQESEEEALKSEEEVPEPEEEKEEKEEEKEEAEDAKDSSDDTKEEITKTGFTARQNERFDAFIQTKFGREQLKTVLENVSMEAGTGNVIIGSEDKDSAIEFGTALISELSDSGILNGKGAKIKASSLNAKDAEATVAKLYDGALIIHDAHELRKETLEALNRAVNAPDKKILVILTTTHRHKHRFVMENNALLKSFNVQYDIETLSSKDLVKYAINYAYKHEYAIDEMALLALHQRIEERQTIEHNVLTMEVREIVDKAIKHASKKNIKNFAAVLTGRRYDENSMILLHEKDFAE